MFVPQVRFIDRTVDVFVVVRRPAVRAPRFVVHIVRFLGVPVGLPCRVPLSLHWKRWKRDHFYFGTCVGLMS